MKFISLQDNLKKGLSIVNHATSKNINLPILNNIMIKLKDSNIELISTNLEIGVIHKIRGRIESEGEFTVDSKVITEYVNLVPNGQIEIEKIGGEIKLSCDKYNTKIKGQEAKEFPLIPIIEKDKKVSVKISEFKKALTQVIFAVSTNESRLELSGVLFDFKNGSLTIAGTDSYRLAEKEIKVDTHGKEIEQKIIIPSRTLQELVRIISIIVDGGSTENIDKIDFYLSENQVLFLINSTELISRLISGQYPDYKQIIPQKSNTEVFVNRQELIRAVKASSIFSKAGINDVNLKFVSDKKEIIVSSISGQTGESVISIDAKIVGSNNDITINHRYLLDGLGNINDDEVNLSIVDNNTPCVIRSEKEKNYLYIVMPIKQ